MTGSSVASAGDQPVVGPRLRASVTLLAALIVLAFTALVSGLLASDSRLAQQAQPQSSLAVVVGRTMDVRFVVERLSPVVRRFAALLMDSRREALAQSIAWYEELAAYDADPSVDLQLAVLEGEAGRRARLREKLEAWEVRPDPYPAMAAAIGAAYLPDVDPSAVEADPGALPFERHPWFVEQLTARLALRRGNQAEAADVLEERLARTAYLRGRVRALLTLELLVLFLPLAGIVVLVRSREGLRLASAPLPPVWPARLGAAVIVRGAALQMVLFGALWLLVQLADSAILEALTWPWSNVFFLPLVLLARRHLITPTGVRLRDALGLSLDPAVGRRLAAVVATLVGVGLAGDWLFGVVGTRLGLATHWTEWFDEDFVWGSGGDAVLALVSAVVVAPLFEELVFRGLVFATFRRRYGFFVSALWSGVVFAILHGYGWAGFASVLWSGVIWAWSYERTRSLVPGMLAHAIVNLLASLGVLLLFR